MAVAFTSLPPFTSEVTSDVVADPVDDGDDEPKLKPPCLLVVDAFVAVAAAVEPNPKLGFALSPLDDVPKPT